MAAGPHDGTGSRSRPWRRPATLLVAGVALATASTVVVATSATASRAPYVVTLPDLQIVVPTDNNTISIGTNTDTGDRQLQFTHITSDLGVGPFQIKPKFNRRTGTATFVQTIYKSRTGSSWRPAYTVHLAATGIFDPPSDYRYPLTRFTLNTMNGDGSPGAVVATSPKSDYCITADAFVGGVPNAPNNTSPPQSDCTSPNKPLGFSVGWGDEYDQTDNGQPIDLTGVADGTYILQATVDPQHLFTESDPHNNVVDTELQISGDSVTVVNQTTPYTAAPAVHLSLPAGGSKVSGTVTLRAPAKVAAPAKVKAVQFLLDGQPLGPAATSAPYTYAWTVGATPPGVHALSAQVTDSAGHMATAAVKTVTVGSTPVSLVRAGVAPPTVVLVNPVARQTVSGTIPVAASPRSGVAVRSVQILVDGRPLSGPVTGAPFAVQWDTTTVADGTHTLSAVVTDAAGATGRAADVTVTVANPAPPMTCFVLQVEVGASGGARVSSPAFHTAAAGETLVAFVAGNGPRGLGRQSATVTGSGLTWRLVTRANAGPGDAEIWTAHAARILTTGTVTSTLARTGSHQHLTVIAMEGITGTGVSSAAAGAGGVRATSLRTSSPTSLVFAVGTGSGTTPPTLPTGWVPLGRHVDRAGHATFWGQYTNQPTGAAGATVRVTSTGPAGTRWNLAAVELKGDGA